MRIFFLKKSSFFKNFPSNIPIFCPKEPANFRYAPKPDTFHRKTGAIFRPRAFQHPLKIIENADPRVLFTVLKLNYFHAFLCIIPYVSSEELCVKHTNTHRPPVQLFLAQPCVGCVIRLLRNTKHGVYNLNMFHNPKFMRSIVCSCVECRKRSRSAGLLPGCGFDVWVFV